MIGSSRKFFANQSLIAMLCLLVAAGLLPLSSAACAKQGHQHGRTRRSIHRPLPPAPSLEDDQYDTMVNEEQQFRLEYIKQQILTRLGLNEAPRVQRKPMEMDAYMHLMSHVQQSRQERSQSQFNGDSLTRTASRKRSGNSHLIDDSEKLFVMPVVTTSEKAIFNLSLNRDALASHPVRKISLLLRQKLEFGAASEGIQVAASSWTSADVTPVIGTVMPDNLSESSENYIDDEPILQWIEYDLTNLLTDAAKYDRLNMIVVTGRYAKISKAYLRVEYDDRRIQRNKRSADCDASGNTSSCCREPFYVNFTHVGWDNWILQPAGYFANYCKGQCDISHARYHHTTVLQKYPLINLCCSPREMSPISLIYIDEDGYVLQKNLPNMVVESCDCA